MFGRGMHRREHNENFSHAHWPMFFDKSMFKEFKDRWQTHHQHQDHREVLDPSSMSLLILFMINEKPSYGYEIMKSMENKFQNNYSPDPEDIYPTLSKLEDIGFITSLVQENKKVYSTTEEGKSYLQNSQEKIDKLMSLIDSINQGVNREDLSELYKTVKSIGSTIFESYKTKHWTKDKINALNEILENTLRQIKEI